MANPTKPKRSRTRRPTRARAEKEIFGDGKRLHEPATRANAAAAAVPAATTPPNKGAVDVAHAAEQDCAERGVHAADDFSVKEESSSAPSTRSPSAPFRTTASRIDGETRAPSASGDSPDEAVAVASAPTQVEPCRWASLTPSPPPRTAPGLKRQLEHDGDDEHAVVPAAKHRRVTNDPPAGSSRLDPTRPGADAELPTAATRENESFDTTEALAAVETSEDAGAQLDEANDEGRSRQSTDARPPTPFRARRSTRARKSNGTRAQSVEAVSIHAAPRRAQPVLRAKAVGHGDLGERGEGKEDLLVLVARFHAHLDHLKGAELTEEADALNLSSRPGPEEVPIRADSAI